MIQIGGTTVEHTSVIPGHKQKADENVGYF